MDKIISISDRLTKIRNSVHLTQSEFSRKLGVKQSYYSELERGKRDVTTKVLESLIKNFNVSSDWILTGKGDMYHSNITNSDKKSSLIENNKGFIDNYLWGGLGSYDKRQIVYYESYNLTQLEKIKQSQLDKLMRAYNSTQNLIDFVNFLNPKELSLMKKFTPIPKFEEYINKEYKEIEDLINDAGDLKDKRLNIILHILYFEELEEHWNHVLEMLLSQLNTSRIIFKARINNPFFDKNE